MHRQYCLHLECSPDRALCRDTADSQLKQGLTISEQSCGIQQFSRVQLYMMILQLKEILQLDNHAGRSDLTYAAQLV